MNELPFKGKKRNTLASHPDNFCSEMVADIDLAWSDAGRLVAARNLGHGSAPTDGESRSASVLADFIFRGLCGSEEAFEGCKSKRLSQPGVNSFSTAMSLMRDARVCNAMLAAKMAEACAMESFEDALSALNKFASQSISSDIDLSALMATMLEAACVEEPREAAAILAKRWGAMASSSAWSRLDWRNAAGQRIEATWGSSLGALGLLLGRHPAAAAEGEAVLAKWQGWSGLGMGEVSKLGEVFGGIVCAPEEKNSALSEVFWRFMPWPAKIGACSVAVGGSPQEEWMWESLINEISAASGTLREEMAAALSIAMWSLLDAPRLTRLEAALAPEEASRWMREYAAALSLETTGVGFANALTASLKDERSEWARSLWSLSGDLPENLEMSELLFSDGDSPWPRMFEILLAHREGLAIASLSDGLSLSLGKGLRI